MEARNEDVRAAGNATRSRATLILVVIAVVALGGGFLYWWHGRGKVTTDDAYVQATIYPISARIPGKVLKVFVEDNQAVKKDQVLVQLDPDEPALQVRVAKAGLEVAGTQHREAEIGLEAALAQNNLVEAQLDQAKLDLDRAESLFKKRAIPDEQYDRAQTQHRVFTAQLQVSIAQIDVAKAKVASALSALENAKSQLSRSELVLSYTAILAPGDGHVTKKSVREGKVVQPGEPLLAVVDLNDIWVEANFKETELTRILQGMKAEVEVDTYPDRVFHGHVDSIMGGTGAAFSLFPSENATGNWVKIVQRIPVKIRLDDYPSKGEENVLRVGMSTYVKILMDKKGKGHPLPPQATNP
jgi:membrane fusion protein (multidrug efflux system)